jgi:putative membrane-bound dehydrogenase-like protein
MRSRVCLSVVILLAVMVGAASAEEAAAPAKGPIPAAEAPKHMTLPQGFTATLFAGEPDIVQPIATTVDDRGRLWVAECLSYPNWTMDGKGGHDRIVILEDQNGDGHFSKKTLFTDTISNISGLEIGHGGVWVCASPNLLFIPIDPSGDKPAGEARVVLDGWNITTAQHNVFNRLVWGPDGWLWGCNGIQSKSLVGKPGTPDAQRTPMNCGVWRYHPVRQVFEVVASGTTNPWGLDFDDYGQAFITNCVIEHLFHVIPGAHYKRMYGEDLDKHAYTLMQTCADHIHWAGGAWTSSRGGIGAHAAAGGGHAHAGCMVYLGDNWPDEFRNNVFMCNIHGNRVNRDILEEKGSGYVAHHGQDFLMANDPWFRGLNLVYGADGGVYVQDWTDTGECHNHQVVDRTNGRIYKVVYGAQPKPVKVDLAKLDDGELVKLQLHKNDWYVRRARVLLAERAAGGKLAASVTPALRKIFDQNKDVTRRLRALWALYSIGDRAAVSAATSDAEPHVRSWGIRLLVDDGKVSPDEAGQALAAAAESDSLQVRVVVASAAQRVSAEARHPALARLACQPDNARDPNLPLMIWYAAEPIVEQMSAADLVGVMGHVQVPLLREYSSRMLAERGPEEAVALLKGSCDAAVPREALVDALRGVQAAVKDVKLAAPPAGWADVSRQLAAIDDAEVRRRALLLSLIFADPTAQAPARAFLNDAKASVDERREVLAALIQSKPKDLSPLLRELLSDKDLGDMAIRAMAAANDAETPKLLIERYGGFTLEHKRDAVATLAARPKWALQLLRAVEEGKLPKSDVGALTVRQLINLKDKAVADEVNKLWGQVRSASKDKSELITQYRAELAPDALKKANLSNGRAIFNRTCAQCHTLFDAGGKLGPDLTGSQRANTDYIIENVLDPSAIVAKEYLMTVIRRNDGEVLTGIVGEETATMVTLKMPSETQTVQKADIKSRKTESISMMPEGLLQAMTPEERRDLVGYLASPVQVPVPPEAK